MQKYFDLFYENIKLTEAQREDAIKKYDGVCGKLHSSYYTTIEYNGSTKLLIGSYGKDTNVRPARDIDVIFKLPTSLFAQYDGHNSNGQSNLLQKIKSILEEKYSKSSLKTSEKVVVIEFSESAHNVDLLPAFELEDSTFIIPNSSNGGFWEKWDPRAELKKLNDSDKKNEGRTKRLTRYIKKWSENCSIDIKSYYIESTVMNFLDDSNYVFIDTQNMILDYFNFMSIEIESKKQSFANTAAKRAKKAIEYEKDNKIIKAIQEWKKIFGVDFPSQSLVKESIYADNDFSPKEQFIEDYYPIELDNDYFVSINCRVCQDGWRPTLLKNVTFLQKRKKLEFFIEESNITEPYDVKWKVKNYGKEAEEYNDLRGEIWNDRGKKEKIEDTKYYGNHYVECYIIKDNKCIAYDRITVPVRN